LNFRALNVRHLAVAIAVSPAVIFLLFLGVFRLVYVTWAEQHAKPIAEAELSAKSGYAVTIDSVAISLSSLTLFKVRIFEHGEEIGEVASIVLHEPSMLSLLFQRKLVVRRTEVGTIRTNCEAVRQFFEAQVTFSADSP
jgi:hypothetical protein